MGLLARWLLTQLLNSAYITRKIASHGVVVNKSTTTTIEMILTTIYEDLQTGYLWCVPNWRAVGICFVDDSRCSL